jgi:hypothetical protein
MHVHQRALLVPGTMACSNLTYFPLNAQAVNQVREREGRPPRNCNRDPGPRAHPGQVEKLEGYFAWAKNESRIAGFNPWHWNTRWGGRSWPTGPCDMMLGAIEMPSVVAKLQDIGHYIRADPETRDLE